MKWVSSRLYVLYYLLGETAFARERFVSVANCRAVGKTGNDVGIMMVLLVCRYS